MSKYPYPIYKTKVTLGNLVGYAWQDRWHENIWFETTRKLYVPLEVDRLTKQLSFVDGLNFLSRVIYAEPLSNLIYKDNPLLKTIPKDSTYNQPIDLPIDYGIKFE